MPYDYYYRRDARIEMLKNNIKYKEEELVEVTIEIVKEIEELKRQLEEITE